MKIQINRNLLPVKAHFFFFFAALGPILPQLNVYGRQLGVSAEVMGYVTAGLPLLWAAAKPTFGYVVDYWPNYRKLVFMLLIVVMTGSYCGLWFIPAPESPIDMRNNNTEPVQYIEHVYQMNDTVFLQRFDERNSDLIEKFTCHWSCSPDNIFEAYLTNTTYVNTIFVDNGQNLSCDALNMNFDDFRGDTEIVCTPKANCDLLCFEDEYLINRTKREIDRNVDDNNEFNDVIKNKDTVSEINKTKTLVKDDVAKSIVISKDPIGSKDILAKISKVVPIIAEENEGGSFYATAAFWSFVILMCIGTVAFNVANCIGDAVCFDVLGPDGSKYGGQRAWGTAGYGLAAFLGGWLVDRVSTGPVKDFTPAFLLALVATAVDLYSCRRLKLPSLSSPEDSGKALRQVLKIPRVIVFICFAVVAGMFDSFIIYYMFWFLEDLAEQTGHQGKIKLIEGIVVAGQSFIGEIVFFALSGRIIKRWGYGATMTLSLFCYGVRMALISLIQNPWHLVPLESVLQGPTYALCYSCIVGYAAHVAPPGYSATVQGIVAGMDDGLGFALGSLVGGQLYSWRGGRSAFRVLALAAAAAAAAHAALFYVVTNHTAAVKPSEPEVAEGEKMLPVPLPLAGTERGAGDIYRDTVVPLAGKDKLDRFYY